MGYTGRAVKGVSWMAGLRAATRGVTFVRIAILARLLSPAEFGVFGIATLLFGLLDVVTETGIDVFLVQEKEDIQKYIDSAWVVSLARGILLSAIIFVSAPLTASFFHSPSATALIRLIALVPLIQGFANPALIRFHKDLEFNKEFFLRFFLFLADSAVAVVSAFILKNATSFVLGLIAGAFLETLLSFVLVKPLPRPSFDMQKIAYILHKGKWVTLLGVFSYFAQQGDNIAVGRLMNAASLGLYEVAYKFSILPLSEITDVVNRVMFPVYAKFSEDKKRLLRAFARVCVLNTIAAIVMGILLFVFAKELILLVIGEKWVSIVPVVKILAAYGVLRAIFGSFSPVFLSVGRQKYVASMTFVRVAALAVTIVPFVRMYGLVGAGYAVLISILAEVPVILFFSYRILRK